MSRPSRRGPRRTDESGCEQGLAFGGEGEPGRPLSIVQRADAKSVARQHTVPPGYRGSRTRTDRSAGRAPRNPRPRHASNSTSVSLRVRNACPRDASSSRSSSSCRSRRLPVDDSHRDVPRGRHARGGLQLAGAARRARVPPDTGSAAQRHRSIITHMARLVPARRTGSRQFAFGDPPIPGGGNGVVGAATDLASALCTMLSVASRARLRLRECKALFASGLVGAAPDLAGLDEHSRVGYRRAPRTAFGWRAAIGALGSWALWRDGRLTVRRWWTPVVRGRSHRAPRRVGAARWFVTLVRSAAASGGRSRGRVSQRCLDSAGDQLLARPRLLRPAADILNSFISTLELSERTKKSWRASRSSAHGGNRPGWQTLHAYSRTGGAGTRKRAVRTAPLDVSVWPAGICEQNFKVVLTGEETNELFLGLRPLQGNRSFGASVCVSRFHRATRGCSTGLPVPATTPREGELWRALLLGSGLAGRTPFLARSRIKMTPHQGVLRARGREALAGIDVAEEWRVPPLRVCL